MRHRELRCKTRRPAVGTVSKPIRVLQVVASLDRGGAETSVMNYYRHTDRDHVQYDFVVHTPRRGAFEQEVEKLGGRVHRLPRFRWINLLAYRSAWRELLLRNPGYSVVHGHFFTISAIYLAVASKFGIRTVAHSHANVPGLKGLLIRGINLPLRQRADVKAACSIDAARFFYGAGAVNRGDVVIINNAIEVERFRFDSGVRAATRSTLGLDDKFVVGHIGRFEYSKNHSFLLDVFAELLRTEPRSTLLLVGDGTRRGEIESRIADLGLTEKVILTGVRSDIPDLLQAMDVFVVPSHYEGLGIVAIESQAAGLPTIVSDRLPHDVHITSLVESLPLAADVARWAAAILKHRGLYDRVSPESEIGDAGFDVTREVRKLEGLYLELAGERPV